MGAHHRRPTAADRGGRGTPRADPPAGDQGAGAAGPRRGGGGRVPGGGVRPAGQVRAAEPAVRRGARRGRPAVRGLPAGRRGGRRGLAERRGRRQRAHPDRVGRRRQRHRRAARDLAPADAGRRLAGRLLPVGAAGRLRRQRHPDPGAARRRHVRRLRHQAVDQQRFVRRLLHPLRAHGRRPHRRAERVHRPGGHAGHDLRRPREEDGAGLRRHHPGPVRRRPDPRRPAHRRRGRRHAGRAVSARLRPARHRRRQHGYRPGSDGARGRLRPRATAVRQDDRGVPGAAVHARRARRRGGAGPRDVPPRGPAQGRRPPFLAAGQHRQADRLGHGDAGGHRCRAGARRQRVHPRLPRRAVTSATPR